MDGITLLTYALVTESFGQFPVFLGGQAVIVGHFDEILALLDRLGITVEEFADGFGLASGFEPVLHCVKLVLFDLVGRHGLLPRESCTE